MSLLLIVPPSVSLLCLEVSLASSPVHSCAFFLLYSSLFFPNLPIALAVHPSFSTGSPSASTFDAITVGPAARSMRSLSSRSSVLSLWISRMASVVSLAFPSSSVQVVSSVGGFSLPPSSSTPRTYSPPWVTISLLSSGAFSLPRVLCNLAPSSVSLSSPAVLSRSIRVASQPTSPFVVVVAVPRRPPQQWVYSSLVRSIALPNSPIVSAVYPSLSTCPSVASLVGATPLVPSLHSIRSLSSRSSTLSPWSCGAASASVSVFLGPSIRAASSAVGLSPLPTSIPRIVSPPSVVVLCSSPAAIPLSWGLCGLTPSPAIPSSPPVVPSVVP